MGKDALNFTLELMSCERLPPAVEQNLSHQEENAALAASSPFGEWYNWKKTLCMPQFPELKWETALCALHNSNRMPIINSNYPEPGGGGRNGHLWRKNDI